MMKKFASAVALAGLATTTLVPPAASAADIAPGAPFRTQADPSMLPKDFPEDAPEEITQSICSVGVPGILTLEDGTEKKVMVTAAHCVHGEEGDPTTESTLQPEVYTPTPEGNKIVGIRDGGNKVKEDPNDPTMMLSSPDWATVALNDDVTISRLADSMDADGNPSNAPVVLTGVRDYRDLEEGEVSFEDIGKPICKHGQTTGHSCGVQLLRVKDGIWWVGQVQPGDSGGVVYDPETREALGVNSMYLLFVFQRAQPADVAIEESYGIPDGQVNERFRLPESTEPTNPVRSMAEDSETVAKWQTEQFIESLPTWDEASESVQNNIDATLQDGRDVVEGIQDLPQDPSQAPQLFDQARESIASVPERAEKSFNAIVDAGLRGIIENAPQS